MAITSTIETNYDDERFQQANEGIDKSLNEYTQTIGGMIDDVDGYYQKLSEQSQQWADKQAQLQQENTDFAIEKIEQQKEQAQKDYQKEQSGAYVDWQKQSNQYGVEAEKMAASGLDKSGYSESSQVSMYNTYQNRVATAREVMSQAKLNYDNNIKEAMLQNNAALAEIYANSYKEQLELALQGFQYKNQLVQNLADKKVEFENTRWSRYQDVLQQINTENSLKLEIEKHNDTQAWQTEQAELDRQHDLKRDEINNAFTEKLEGIKHNYEIKLLDAKTEKEKELAKYEYDLAVKKAAQEKQDKLDLLDKELANAKSLAAYEKSLSGGSASISGSSISSYESSGSDMAQIIKNKNNEVNTAYYKGTKNSDASKYGTFSNGYQPKGISGHGTLTKSKDKKGNVEKVTIKTQTLSGQKQTVIQNVWKAEDGTKWYWEGRQNKYIQIK